MKRKTKVYIAVLCIGFAACQPGNQNSVQMKSNIEAETVYSLATEVAPTDSARQIIRTAQLQWSVRHIHETLQHIHDTLSYLQGHIYHYELNEPRYLEKTVQATTDSAYNLYRIEPTASIRIKLPVQHTQAFVRFMLQQPGNIQHFVLDEEDVTAQISNEKEIAELLAKQSSNRVSQIDPIMHASASRTLLYKTQFMWFDVTMQGDTQYMTVPVEAPIAYETPVGVKVWQACLFGWRGFMQMVIGILHLWPLILIGLILYGMIKKRRWLHMRWVARK